MTNKSEYQQLADEAGWKIEARGDNLHFERNGKQLTIEKDLTDTPSVSKSIRPVNIGQLRVEQQFQRMLDERRVSYLVSTWSFAAIGTLTVSERSDGSMIILDGQHRKAAMMHLGGSHTVDCLVYKGLTLAQEAYLFNKLNDRLNVHPITRYKARLLAGERAEAEIEAILIQYGTKTEWHVAQGYPCVGALLKAHSCGKEVLRDVIELLEACWPEDLARRTPIVVSAMIQFRRSEHAFDMNRAIRKLETHPLKALVQAAKSDRAAYGGKGIYWWLARRFQTAYTKGRRHSG